MGQNIYIVFSFFRYVYQSTDVDKIRGLGRKAEGMLRFFIKNSKNVFDKLSSKEPQSSFSNTEHTADHINGILAVLRGLAMFYAYNANWAEPHLPDEIKRELKERNTVEKHTTPTGAGFGAFTFQLSIPYTQEVNLKYYTLIFA